MKGTDVFHRHPPVVVFLLIAVTILIAWSYLPLSTTILALFVVVSFTVSGIVFYATTDLDESAETESTDESAGVQSRTEIRESDWTYAKVITIAAALAVSATVWFDARGPAVAAFLLIGYLTVTYQIRRDVTTTAVLYELVVLFAVPLFAKFLTTGLYFGSGDVLRHVAYVQGMLDAGNINGLPPSYARYPAFHLLVGSVRELFGLATYDAIVLTGLFVYSMLVPVVYLTATKLADDERVALGAGVAFTLLLTPKPYVLAFYPQALAVVMLFVGLYLNASLIAATTATTVRRYAAFVLLLVVAMVTTHHLTFFVASIPVVVLLGFLLVQQLVETRSVRSALTRASNIQYVYAYPLLFAAVGLFTYWLYTPSNFLSRIIGGLATFFLLTTDRSTTGTYRFGNSLQIDEVQLAVQWLLSADAFYYALLGGLFLVAFYEIVRNWRTYRYWLPLLATGLVMGGLLLPLPIPIPWFDRIRLVIVVVVVFPLGVAVARAFRSKPKYPRYAIATLVVVSAGTSVAFTAPVARDLSPSATNSQQVKIEFSEREYRAMQSLASFLREHGTTTVSGMVLSRVTLRNEGYPDASVGVWLGDGGLRADGGLLVVHEYWTDHRIILHRKDILISEDRFAATTARRNKVYASAGISLFWSEDRFTGLFGTGDATAENATSNTST